MKHVNILYYTSYNYIKHDIDLLKVLSPLIALGLKPNRVISKLPTVEYSMKQICQDILFC